MRIKAPFKIEKYPLFWDVCNSHGHAVQCIWIDMLSFYASKLRKACQEACNAKK